MPGWGADLHPSQTGHGSVLHRVPKRSLVNDVVRSWCPAELTGLRLDRRRLLSFGEHTDGSLARLQLRRDACLVLIGELQPLVVHGPPTAPPATPIPPPTTAAAAPKPNIAGPSTNSAAPTAQHQNTHTTPALAATLDAPTLSSANRPDGSTARTPIASCGATSDAFKPQRTPPLTPSQGRTPERVACSYNGSLGPASVDRSRAHQGERVSSRHHP